MPDLHFKYKSAIDKIKTAAPFKPDLAVVLGSGLGNFADSLNTLKVLSTDDLPGYPASTIPGHSGKVYFSEYKGKNVILFKGRVHFYEGNKISECILPILLSRTLGTEFLLLTNAAGGVNPNFEPGDLMLAESFNGINFKKEITALIGLTGIIHKNYFNDFPSTELNSIIISAAKKAGIGLKHGVYWFTKGPSYETPAEVRMIGKYGGDAVGMSTVHEAVYGVYSGMKTSTISCITNYAAGISCNKLSHADVTYTAKLVEEKFGSLLREVINNLKLQE